MQYLPMDFLYKRLNVMSLYSYYGIVTVLNSLTSGVVCCS